MYRVLIAEDEMLVRLGLKHSINWSEYGMTVIADVTNGQEALDIFRKDKPEVVITDIKMPIMDGMELIAQVRELDANAQIAILTCVEDFDAVRKAMAYNVHEYILKLEMTTEDMGRVLAKIREKLDRMHKPAPAAIEVDVQLWKDKLVKDYLFGLRYSEDEFTSRASQLKMRIYPQHVAVALMEVDQYDRLCERFQDVHGQLVRMSLLNVLCEVLSNYGCGEAFADGADDRYLLLFGFAESASEPQTRETIHTIIDHIRSVLNMYFNISVTFAIHRAQRGYPSLKEQYRACIRSLDERFFYGFGSSIEVHGPNATHRQAIPEAIRQLLLQLVCEWKTDESGRKALERHIRTFLSTDLAVDPGQIKRAFTQWIWLAALEKRLAKPDMPDIVSAFNNRIAEARTLQETIDIFRHFIRTLMSNQANMSKEVSDVIRYIDGHYAEELPLQQLADYVQVSPNYLSSLFKKETGVNFADYLLRYRIEKAKELLLGTYRKTYEIAEQTGFANQSYFSRAFKKLTGIGPKEYRRNGATGPDKPEEVPNDAKPKL